MKSEKNNQGKIQIRSGTITHNSYLFFSRELGDLLLEPGDEVILIGKEKWKSYKEFRETFMTVQDDKPFENREGIFYKIRKRLVTEEATHKLTNRTFDAFGCLKDAIHEYYTKGRKT